MDDGKRGHLQNLVRLFVLLLFAVAFVRRALVRFPGRPLSVEDSIDLLEIFALAAPLLWINSVRRLAIVAMMLPLIWLGFKSIQEALKHEYFYSVGFAASCVICTFTLLQRSE